MSTSTVVNAKPLHVGDHRQPTLTVVVYQQRGNELSVELSFNRTWRALHNGDPLSRSEIPIGRFAVLQEAACAAAKEAGISLEEYDQHLRETVDWEAMSEVKPTDVMPGQTTYLVRIEVDVIAAVDAELKDVAIAGMRQLVNASPDNEFVVYACEYGSTVEGDFNLPRRHGELPE